MNEGATDRKRMLAFGFAVAAMAFLPYASTVRHGYVFDDVQLVAPSPALRGGGGLVQAFRSDLYRFSDPTSVGSSYYRPLAQVSFYLNALPWSGPGILHLGNALLHALATVLLFRLLGRGGHLVLAASAALWWALHPLQVETVAWISGRYDLLSGVACMGLLLLQGRAGLATGIARVLLFAAGLLSKETTVVMVGVLLVDDWSRRRPLRVSLARVAPLAVVVPLWLLARQASGVLPLALPPLLKLPVHFLSAVWVYLARTVAPFPLSISIDYSPVQGPALIAAGAAVLLLAWMAIRWRSLATPVALLFSSLGLASLALDAMKFAPDRYYYIPSLGLAMLAYQGLLALEDARPRLGGVCTAALACWAVLGGIATVLRVPDWASDSSLFAAELRQNPEQGVAYLQFGLMAARRGEHEIARTLLESAQSRLPDSELAATALAFVHEQRGEHAALLVQARRAVALEPRYPLAWLYLGAGHHFAGDHLAERAALERAVALSPGFLEARLQLALAMLEAGERDKAERELANLSTGNGPVAQHASIVRIETAIRSGRHEDARRHLDGLRARWPDSPDLERLSGKLRETPPALP